MHGHEYTRNTSLYYYGGNTSGGKICPAQQYSRIRMGRNMHSSNTLEYNRMRWQNMLGIFVAEYGQTKPQKDAIIYDKTMNMTRVNTDVILQNEHKYAVISKIFDKSFGQKRDQIGAKWRPDPMRLGYLIAWDEERFEGEGAAPGLVDLPLAHTRAAARGEALRRLVR